jgi:hypothetical protein
MFQLTSSGNNSLKLERHMRRPFRYIPNVYPKVIVRDGRGQRHVFTDVTEDELETLMEVVWNYASVENEIVFRGVVLPVLPESQLVAISSNGDIVDTHCSLADYSCTVTIKAEDIRELLAETLKSEVAPAAGTAEGQRSHEQEVSASERQSFSTTRESRGRRKRGRSRSKKPSVPQKQTPQVETTEPVETAVPGVEEQITEQPTAEPTVLPAPIEPTAVTAEIKPPQEELEQAEMVGTAVEAGEQIGVETSTAVEVEPPEPQAQPEEAAPEKAACEPAEPAEPAEAVRTEQTADLAGEPAAVPISEEVSAGGPEPEPTEVSPEPQALQTEEHQPAKTTRRRRTRKKPDTASGEGAEAAPESAGEQQVEPPAPETGSLAETEEPTAGAEEQKPRRRRSRKKTTEESQPENSETEASE